MYNLEQLKLDRDLWKGLEVIPIQCSMCSREFETKYGTLYNVIRRNAEGIYCSRKCTGTAKAISTQNKYKTAGGKTCKRCGEFRELSDFSPLSSPPYFRSECRRCHNYKPARQYSLIKERAIRNHIPFSISLDYFLRFWEKNCFYCDIHLNGIRLEMLHSENGYIENNVVSCCSQCQKFKNNLNHEIFINLCHKISENLKRSE